MVKRFLQVVGFLTVLAVLGAGAVSVFFVKQRFHVTVAGDETEQKAGPDPATLLRDDVASLRRDVAALAGVLSKNFETLAAEADAADAERRAALDRTIAPWVKATGSVEASVGALSARVEAFAERTAAADADARAREAVNQQAWREAIATLATRIDASAAVRTTTAAIAPPAAATPASPMPPTPTVPTAAPPTSPALPAPPPPPAPLATVPTATTPTSTLPAPIASTSAARPVPTTSAAPAPTPSAPPSPPPPPPSPRRKGFLAFSLPSQSLDVDHPEKFEIVASLSRVGFDAKSTLHDFTGVTSEVSGTFVATLARPGVGTTGHVEAVAASIDTGVVERNTEMLTTLDVKRFPAIAFDLASFEPASVDPATHAATGTGRGRMTIRGVTLDVAFPLRISLDEGRRVVIEGEVPLKLSAYGVSPPKAMGVIAVEDTVKVWVSLRGRAVGRAE